MHNYNLIDTVQQIVDRLKNLPNLNKIRQENWDLLRLQVKTRVLLRKIEIKIKENKKQLEQHSRPKQQQSNKI